MNSSPNSNQLNKPKDHAKIATHMPSEETIWLFIIGDMAVFSLFFCVYAIYRHDNLAEFQAAQATLNLHAGAINTLILLLGSLFVVLALKASRLNLRNRCFWLLNAATVCGIIFSIIKVIEYNEKSKAGITWMTNDFYMLYYLLTGIHFVHLLTAVGMLMYFAFVIRFGDLDEKRINAFESGGIFWHMVDLLWIIIFPLLYLLP